MQGEECCEITGVGPVPVRVARRLLGDSILNLILTRGIDVAHVTHLGRGPTAAQRTALLWSSPHCCVVGCHRTRVEIDHRIAWAHTHHTRLDELDLLCKHHHDLKTLQGWALTPGTGPRPLVSPDDTRHPNHGPPP
ncbi:MAG: HNH endonuclease signature motif containing protein [Acidimicrobiales bacterium]